MQLMLYSLLLVYILTIIFLGTSNCQKKGLPEIRIVQSRIANGIPSVTVRFGDGHSDIMKLKKSKIFPNSSDDGCNYIGHLISEGTPVALTGCLNKPEDKVHLTMFSDHVDDLIHTVDAQGNVEREELNLTRDSFQTLPIPKENMRTDTSDGWHIMSDDDEIVNENIEALTNEAHEKCKHDNCTLPPMVSVNIKIGYEKSLKEYLECTGINVDLWIEEVFTHVQVFFMHKSLDTKVFLNVLPGYLYADKEWTVAFSLADAANYSEPIVDPSTVTVWFCAAHPDKYLGMAYLSGLCAPYQRSSISEIRFSVALTALTVSHELGHNLGMNHDFAKKHENKSCAGIMSYVLHPDHWSYCSNSDFKDAVHAKKWMGTCLHVYDEEVDPDNPRLPGVADKYRDGKCDKEYNKAEFNFDGGDCCLEQNLDLNCYDDYYKCDSPVHRGDGFCDPLNNVKECGYDGGDCCRQDHLDWNKYCEGWYKCKCLDPTGYKSNYR